jgi:hypothetical protein
VRDGVTKAPIAGVAVEASGPQFKRSTTTDGNGEFTFDHLAPGYYGLKYTMQGYLPANFTGSSQATIRKPDTVERITLELLLAGRLEGVVVDEEGRPVPGVMLYSGTGHLATTGADGRYAIENLRPGNYTFLLRTPFEIRSKSLKRDPETGETFGYPNSAFFPGVADAQAATTVAVSRGLDLRRLDIRMRRTRLVNFSGLVLNRAGGEPLTEGRVELFMNNGVAPLLDDSYRERPLAADGSFHFDLIQPGSHTLVVYRAKDAGALPYLLPVEIPKTGIEDLRVAVAPFLSLRGYVLAPADSAWNGQFIFNIRSPLYTGISRDFTINSESFSIDDLPPGKWLIQVESNITRVRDSARLFIQSTTLGQQNTSTDPVTVAESGNPPFEIRVTPESGRVLATVVDQNGNPRPGIIVVLNRSGPGTFMPSRISGVTKVDGTVSLADLPPGHYRVSALTLNDASVSRDAILADVKLGETAVVRITAPVR